MAGRYRIPTKNLYKFPEESKWYRVDGKDVKYYKRTSQISLVEKIMKVMKKMHSFTVTEEVIGTARYTVFEYIPKGEGSNGKE